MHPQIPDPESLSWNFYGLFRLLSASFDQLNQKLDTIMSAISDFATKQNAHNDKIDAAIAGLVADNKAQTDLIAQLQSTQGQITPEDQALLDQIDARNQAVADKLAALDALNPPTPPTTGGTP